MPRLLNSAVVSKRGSPREDNAPSLLWIVFCLAPRKRALSCVQHDENTMHRNNMASISSEQCIAAIRLSVTKTRKCVEIKRNGEKQRHKEMPWLTCHQNVLYYIFFVSCSAKCFDAAFAWGAWRTASRSSALLCQGVPASSSFYKRKKREPQTTCSKVESHATRHALPARRLPHIICLSVSFSPTFCC